VPVAPEIPTPTQRSREGEAGEDAALSQAWWRPQRDSNPFVSLLKYNEIKSLPTEQGSKKRPTSAPRGDLRPTSPVSSLSLLEALDAGALDVVRGTGRRSRGRDRSEAEVRLRRGRRPVLAVQGALEEDVPLQDRRHALFTHDCLGAIDENVAAVIFHLEVDSGRCLELSGVAGRTRSINGLDDHVHRLGAIRPVPTRPHVLEDDLIGVDVLDLAEAVGTRCGHRSWRGRRCGRR
jgi:hypothetical protein